MNYFEQVYEIVKKIPKGKVMTYKDVAECTDRPRGARVVGWALHSNPYQGVVPCHRVVTKEGKLSSNFRYGGYNRQRQLLEEEGITFTNDGLVDMGKHRLKIKKEN